jgi:GNAT superfamily N-acetyltransferase
MQYSEADEALISLLEWMDNCSTEPDLGHIHFSSHLSRCKALELGQCGADHLRKIGFGDGMLNTSDSALWIEDDRGQPVGILVFSIDGTCGEDIWLDLAYVIPEHRGKGMFTALFRKLVDLAADRGALTIGAGIHRENRPMLQAADANELELVYFEGDQWVHAGLYL